MLEERDYQRTRLYRSEWEILDDFDILSLLDCWTFCADVLTHHEVRQAFPKTTARLWRDDWLPGPSNPAEYRPTGRLVYLHHPESKRSLRIKPGYRRRTAESSGTTIILPIWARNRLTITHEIAHLCTWYDSRNGLKLSNHGKEFAGNYITLVNIMLGSVPADALRHHMIAHKVKIL